ncbi:MAG: flavodoxin domain-containing protein [Anaerovorax sp.]|nr:flavodoxin domain-containing protein [Anaerovorax sp.]
MKTSIVYASMTGHSKKIALEIARELNISVYNIKENPLIDSCDLLFIVSGIYGGQCKQELLEFVKHLKNTQVKSAALITSSMKKVAQKAIREVLTSNGIEVKEEEYLCQGGFLFMGVSHPNKDEITGAVEFAKKYIVD